MYVINVCDCLKLPVEVLLLCTHLISYFEKPADQLSIVAWFEFEKERTKTDMFDFLF